MTEPAKTIHLRPKGSTTGPTPSPLNANSTIRLKAPDAGLVSPSPIRVAQAAPSPIPPPAVRAPTPPPAGMRIISPPSPPVVDTSTSMLSAVEIQRPPLGQVPKSTIPTDTGTMKLVSVSGRSATVVPGHTVANTTQSTASRPISINTTASRPLGAPIGTGTTALPKLEITNSATTIKLDTPPPPSVGSTIRLSPAGAPSTSAPVHSSSATTIKLNTPAGVGKKTLSLKRDNASPLGGGPSISSNASTIKFESQEEEKTDFAEASIFQEPSRRFKHEKPDQLPFSGGFIYLGFGLVSAIVITIISLGVMGQLSNLWPANGEFLAETEYTNSPTFAPYDTVLDGRN